MGRPPRNAHLNASWVDYWIDNTNYCAFFGCDDDENSVGGNGCCTGSTLLSHLNPTYDNRRTSLIASDGCTSSMSKSFRMSSSCGADIAEEDETLSNFVAKHDAFLDSLLHEQQQQLLSRPASPIDENLAQRVDSTFGTHLGLNTSAVSIATTHSWSLSPTSSNDSLSDNGIDNPRYNSDGSATRKRRRGLLLVATPRISHASINSISSTSSATHIDRPPLRNSSNRNLPPLHISNSINLQTSKDSKGTLITPPSGNISDAKESPDSFLHPSVRLQKDKGKGSDVGSEICAKGIPACVGKLRQKMQLLTEHCCVQPNQNGTSTIATTSGAVASMKRRNAIITERHTNFLETRSLITLRMGFLSMTYGVLLRWDIGKTGLVTVVVLRKNCHESFYRKKMSEQMKITKSLSSAAMSTSCLQRSPTMNSVSTTTSMDDDDECDDIVRLNRPPYMVTRPTLFAPSEITISVLYATGLNKKSHWTVQLQLGEEIENVLLSYDGAMMIPKLGGPLQYVIPPTYLPNSNSNKKSLPTISSGNMDAVLEIRLLEHKVRRKTRVLRCSMVLPLYSLEASRTMSTTPASTQLRIPCPDGAAIQLEATLVSDEAIWQRDELAARQKQQEQQKWWKGTNKNIINSPIAIINDDINERNSSSWDWLFCSLC